jgi:hypothetical protein
MHERVSSGERGRVGMMGNMLRRGESIWSCMKFEFAFLTGHGIFDKGPSAFFSCVACE